MIHATQGRFSSLLGQAGVIEDQADAQSATAGPQTQSKVNTFLGQWWTQEQAANRQVVIGGIILLALVAFELFNFDTTRFALNNLLGDIEFFAVQWSTILAVAFCGIDFAGLARLFRPQRSGNEPVEAWYLMGAWFLAATMNAVMTWWAVSVQLTTSTHQLGNEVLSREQLLHYVPIFVAVLVWLTRILIIGAVTMAGHQANRQAVRVVSAARPVAAPQPRSTTASASSTLRMQANRQPAATQGAATGFGANRRLGGATSNMGRATLAGMAGGATRSNGAHKTVAMQEGYPDADM